MGISESSYRISSVSVEYDKNGSRAVKTFSDSYRARRFYSEKFKAGKNPKVVSASR